jgi:hypothetical protein
MPPGPALAGFLASIDVERVSGYDRIVVLRAIQRQASHTQAQLYTAIAAVADHMESVEFPDDRELAWEAAATEIRAALRLTRRAAETETDLAVTVRRRLPRVWNALLRGSIDRPRAVVIAHGTAHLDEEAARRVVDAIIGDAPGLTTGQLAARLRRLCAETDPDAATERYAAAVEQRRITLEASPEGTAHLYGLDLPPHQALAAVNRVNDLAMELNRAGDSRSIDQLRADVLLDLLTGRHNGARGGVVELRVDLTTLAGLSDTPGDLTGYGPVVADIARQVTAAQTDGEWRFTITHPDTGLPLHDGTTRRRPTATQRRSVQARDRHCIFPGCRIPATQCDLDHRIPWAQHHHTATHRLGTLCRHDHHTSRHHLGWTYQPLPNSDHLWTSPLGHHYTTSGHPP